jgi:hypothetical protein
MKTIFENEAKQNFAVAKVEELTSRFVLPASHGQQNHPTNN